MASIYRNRSGNWECRIRRRGYPPQMATFDTKTAAQRWADALEGDIARGRFVDRREAEATTLREALKRYLVEVTPRKRSAGPERYNARVILESKLADMMLASIRSAHVSEFVRDQEARGASAHSIRIYLGLLSNLYNVAKREWGIESIENPVAFARRPKLPPGRDRRLKPGEEDVLLVAAPRELRNAIILALETALRRGELLNLRWDDIDLAAGTAAIRETKTDVPRTVALTPRAIEILRKIPRRLDGKVFGYKDHHSVTQGFERLCRRLRIADLRWHDLRHEATSRFFERGLSIEKVAAITGHRTWAMLKRYTHPRAEDIARELAENG